MWKRLILLLVVMACVAGCATSEQYFKERIDKTVVLEGGWRQTGIKIKLPSTQEMAAASVLIGHEVGWAVLVGAAQGAEDSFLYEHVEDIKAMGTDTIGAGAGSSTSVRVDQRGYLGAE